MKAHVALSVLALSASCVFGDPEITAFQQNGQIAWNDPSGTGTHYAVQWSTSNNSRSF